MTTDALPLWTVILEEAVAVRRLPLDPNSFPIHLLPEGDRYLVRLDAESDADAAARLIREVRKRADAIAEAGSAGSHPGDMTITAEMSDPASADPQRVDRACLREVYRVLHIARRGKDCAALCCSGGGIRSATFHLGMFQSLAAKGLLDAFDYLSTVSGGGYAAAWLTAWSYRRTHGIHDVQSALAAPPNRTAAGGGGANPELRTRAAFGSQQVNGEVAEVAYLREYSNYLIPRTGVFAKDMWAVLATYPSHLLLNWMVLLPMIGGAILLAWAFALTFHWRGGGTVWYTLWWFGSVAVLVGVGAAIPLLPRRDLPRTRTFNSKPRTAPSNHPPPRIPWAIWLNIVTPIVLGSLALALRRLHPEGDVQAANAAERDAEQNFFWIVAVYSAILAVITLVAGFLRYGSSAWSVGSLLRIILIYQIAGFCSAGASYWLTVSIKPLTETAAFPRVDKPAPARSDNEQHLPPVSTAPAAPSPGSKVELCRTAYATLALPLRMVPILILFTLVVGLTSERYSTFLEHSREWWAALMGLLLMVTVWPSVILATCVLLPQFLLSRDMRLLVGGLSASALATTIAGIALGTSRITKAVRFSLSATLSQRLAAKVPWLIAGASLLLLVIVYSVIIGTLVMRYTFDQSAAVTGVSGANILNVLWVAIGCFAFAIVAGIPINVNRFSLHGVYRSRLIRAYLGASRGTTRNADSFTEFDPDDNFPLYHLRRSQRITRAHISDLDALVGLLLRLRTPQGERSARLRDWLCERLSPIRLEILKRAAQLGGSNQWPSDVAAEVEKVVLAALNDAVNCGRLIDSSKPNTADLPGDIEDAYRRFESGDSPCMANRLLIERYLLDADGRAMIVSSVPKPFHVINATVNLVAGRRLAWSERKACGFTMSPLHSGFYAGYRSSAAFGDGITLGTAMTISGAAVSPNMGYHSSRIVSLLLMLFNVRLGWWLGNPAKPSMRYDARVRPALWSSAIADLIVHGERRDSYELPSPRFSAWSFLAEAIGLTDEDQEYVYLSDGGHFENLGFYCMVQRRCGLIVVGDASSDPKAELFELANAIRKVRIDLGIPVTVRKVSFRVAEAGAEAVRYCTVGRIQYSVVDGPDAPDGVFIYVKPALTGREPIDIFNYGRGSDDFPHETTLDQFFSESQFESYRALAAVAIDTICSAGAIRRGDLASLHSAAERYVEDRVKASAPTSKFRDARRAREGRRSLSERFASNANALDSQPRRDPTQDA